ncbi:MAG TPA: type II secretion system F family protein [Acidimicrobiales bacterium]|nr:type II secretion system F family protein [Acidimicrobiales bacterium]
MLELVVGCIAAGMAVALLVAVASLRTADRAAVRATLERASTTVTAVGSASVDRRTGPSFGERVLLPLAGRVLRKVVLLTPPGYAKSARRRLVLAGRPHSSDFDRFMAARVASILLIPLVLALAVLLPVSRFGAVMLFLLISVFLLLGPDAWLNRKVADRQEKIRLQLPDVIDLLTISVEAGLGFEQALSRTVVAVPGALSEEFLRVLAETRVGASRRQAFEAMDERTDVVELRSFLQAIVQAETFGVSIAQILRVQSGEMRIARRQRAQEKAQKAPVKMLFPLVFCILPALFVVIVGPAVLQIYHTLIQSKIL